MSLIDPQGTGPDDVVSGVNNTLSWLLYSYLCEIDEVEEACSTLVERSHESREAAYMDGS